jgi:type IV pilus assembly protein PilN
MIRINLLKPETKDIKETSAEGMPESKKGAKPGIGNLIFLVLVLALAGSYFFQKKAMTRENQLLTQAREEKGKYQYVIAKLDELQKQKASLEKKIGLINLLKSQQDLAVRIMDELSRGLPEWVWLNEVTTDSKNIQVKGNALSNNLVADFIANLENSGYFENVNLISSAQKTSQKDQFLEFSLSAAVVNPKQKALVPPPPAADKGTRRLP